METETRHKNTKMSNIINISPAPVIVETAETRSPRILKEYKVELIRPEFYTVV